MSYCKIEAPYPPAGEGQKRIIFALEPHEEQEERDSYMLQIFPGYEVDAAADVDENTVTGNIEECSVEGYGYSYYRVKVDSAVAPEPAHSTAPRRFVTVANLPMVAYDSRRPVVVYLPEDAQLRYSVWTSGKEMVAAQGEEDAAAAAAPAEDEAPQSREVELGEPAQGWSQPAEEEPAQAQQEEEPQAQQEEEPAQEPAYAEAPAEAEGEPQELGEPTGGWESGEQQEAAPAYQAEEVQEGGLAPQQNENDGGDGTYPQEQQQQEENYPEENRQSPDEL